MLPQLGAAHASRAELMELQRAAREVHASAALLDYVQALVDYTPQVAATTWPACRRARRSRCCIAARAWALIEGRDR